MIAPKSGGCIPLTPADVPLSTKPDSHEPTKNFIPLYVEMYACHICLHIRYLNKHYYEHCFRKIWIRNMHVMRQNVVECLISKPEPAGKKYLVTTDAATPYFA